MANISKIQLPDGVIYDLKDEVSGYVNVDFGGSSNSAAGTRGLVPAPDSGSRSADLRFLTSAGDWGKITIADANGNSITSAWLEPGGFTKVVKLTNATQSIAGLMSSSDKTKLDNLSSGSVTSVAASGTGGITISGSPITTDGTLSIGLDLSAAINGLGVGTSPATIDDYMIVQWAGGGTTNTTYLRRKLSNLIVGKAVADQNGLRIDTGYLKLTGGTVTGPTTFGDSVSIDDLNAGNLVVNGSASVVNQLSVGGLTSLTSGHVVAGKDGDTTQENQVAVGAGAGYMYMFSQASTTGNRGIYLRAHGTGAAKAVFSVDTNNNVTFNGTLNGSLKPIELTNQNLNDLKPNNTTYYFAAGSNTVTNGPFSSGTAFGMEIYRSAGNIQVQEVWSTVGTVRWCRSWDGNNSTWGSWTQLKLTDTTALTSMTETLGTAHGGTGNTAQTANKLIYAETATKLSSSPALAYFTGTNTATTPATYYRLHIHGSTYGNTAANMISGTAGLFSFGDGGPQITFDTNATPGANQAGALIFTDHDSAATGASFHFVSNQSDWNVTSKRFHARTGISVGTDLPPQRSGSTASYALQVTGQTFHNGNVYFANGTSYYINNSGSSRLAQGEFLSATSIVSNPQATPWPNLLFSSRAGTSAIGTGTTTYTTIAQSGWATLYYQIPAIRKTYQTAGDTSSTVTATYQYPAKFFFRQYSPSSSGTRTAYYEDYNFPDTNVGRAGSAGFNILTTKNVVSSTSAPGSGAYGDIWLVYTD